MPCEKYLKYVGGGIFQKNTKKEIRAVSVREQKQIFFPQNFIFHIKKKKK